jgi:hypothetical protein
MIIMVQAENYNELIRNIQGEINDREDTLELQKIDYFAMKENECGACTAIILFKSKTRNKNGQND